MEAKWYHKVKWQRVGHTVYELDETDTCNKFSVHMQGGWSIHKQGWDNGVKTTDAELDQYAALIHAAPETATQRDELLEALKRIERATISQYLTHADMAVTLQSIASNAIARATGASS